MVCRAGGADVYSEALAIGLMERGHQVTILCQQASELVQRRLATACVEMPDYDHWPAVWRAAPYLRWRRWQRFIASIDLPRPDVLISSKGFCSAALKRRFPNTALIYLPHSRIEPVEIDQMLPPTASKIQRKLACGISSFGERWSLLNAVTTVRFTAGNVADLRAHYRLPDQVRFDVIPAGIIGPASVPARKPGADLRLLSVGRLVESKNLRFLIESLATMPDRSWRLDVVGDGPERPNLERVVSDLALTERVCFHGHRQDLQTFYAEADLHVFPSRLESLGLVVLEAMAHGVPTLAIQADGDRYRNANHELITHEVDGLLAGDEAEFRRLLRSCIERSDCLSRYTEAARQTYLQRHQWAAVIDRWEELLREVVPPRTDRRVPAAGKVSLATKDKSPALARS
jgi:glycosyltransferase involved in cell wall biosynthesis